MTIALVCWRSMLRASWRQAVVVTLLGGVLGAVALAALAGARSTEGAYGRYLKAINASDVQVNVPGALSGLPIMEPVKRLWSLPGAVSHATYVGLNALPVVRGKIDDSFVTASIDGSVDGAGFAQDTMTVVSGVRASSRGGSPSWGRLPCPRSAWPWPIMSRSARGRCCPRTRCSP